MTGCPKKKQLPFCTNIGVYTDSSKEAISAFTKVFWKLRQNRLPGTAFSSQLGGFFQGEAVSFRQGLLKT